MIVFTVEVAISRCISRVIDSTGVLGVVIIVYKIVVVVFVKVTTATSTATTTTTKISLATIVSASTIVVVIVLVFRLILRLLLDCEYLCFVGLRVVDGASMMVAADVSLGGLYNKYVALIFS
jgi:hypothetical protein